jgi:ribosomal protein S27E
LGCKCEWVAVAPTGTYELECPECGGWKGIFKHPVGSSDRPTFVCKCGCHLFYITQPFEVNCHSCGATIDTADL